MNNFPCQGERRINTLFAGRQRGRRQTLEADWLKFERGLVYIAMATPYLALAAKLLELQRLHLAVKEVDTDYWI